MRAIAAILFVLGIPWALIAWIAVFGGPAGAIEDFTAALHHRERLVGAILQIPMMLLFSAHAACGYFIWARWLTITRGKGVASRRFWLLASGHHLAWVVFAVICYFQNDTPPLVVAIFAYSVLVMLACFAAAIIAHRTSTAAQACS